MKNSLADEPERTVANDIVAFFMRWRSRASRLRGGCVLPPVRNLLAEFKALLQKGRQKYNSGASKMQLWGSKSAIRGRRKSAPKIQHRGSCITQSGLVITHSRVLMYLCTFWSPFYALFTSRTILFLFVEMFDILLLSHFQHPFFNSLGFSAP